jgi:hypothetical protein
MLCEVAVAKQRLTKFAARFLTNSDRFDRPRGVPGLPPQKSGLGPLARRPLKPIVKLPSKEDIVRWYDHLSMFDGNFNHG